jgi:hypothetical protein
LVAWLIGSTAIHSQAKYSTVFVMARLAKLSGHLYFAQDQDYTANVGLHVLWLLD